MNEFAKSVYIDDSGTLDVVESDRVEGSYIYTTNLRSFCKFEGIKTTSPFFIL